MRAELARHLHVSPIERDSFFSETHIECTRADGSSVSSSEGEVVADRIRMTCEAAETSQGKLLVRTKR